QSVHDRRRGEGAVDLVVAPDRSRFGDVARLRGVDAREITQSLAVLGVLADRDVDAVLVEDGRGDHLAGTLGGRVLERLAVLHPVLGRVAVVAPELLEESGPVRFFRWVRAVAVADPV